ncbi:hypothetical protein HMPREF9970_0376 [Lachnoanaerobaculum saburreum F0468]|uniref:Uncharacterized protein n=1 Tax=Lachnoanaerobaculum saburreum F0468 TaxID=1095750 RepID=I0R7J5_9FIRM|nr:hypothetical protein [Lachnoanaerobaculum saburreum]EIC95653.1 hypothetical protein HMPREF9970_0376 [Lachnoanaerobaculum saburreum F0468]
MNKKNIKRNILRKTKMGVAVLQIVLMVSLNMLSVPAAAPKVSVDETVYANLDYYGVGKELSIVKGVSLNGYTGFSDYGDYSNVINMTSENAPKLDADQVSFASLDSSKKFYYEVTPKSNDVELPWAFDVSYKLNGVPAKAENLAGASGMVEINISAKPVKTKSDYLNNNMILMLGTDVDMTKNLSVEAPGAQIQSLGKNTVVLFMAFPGEEKDFTVRIGSDSFESAGVMMAMVPATMDSLDKIKEINDAKDDVKGSVNAIYNSSNTLLDVMNSMGGGLRSLNGGLRELQSARATIHSYGDSLTGQTDAVIQNLNSLADETSQAVSHLVTSKNALNDFNKDINKIDLGVTDLKPVLYDLTDSMGEVGSSISHIGYLLNQAKTSEATAALNDLSNKLIVAKKKATLLRQMINGSKILATASNAEENGSIYSMDKSLKELYAGLTGANMMDETDGNTVENLYYNSLKDTVTSTSEMYQGLSKMLQKTDAYIEFVDASILNNGVNAIRNLNDSLITGRNLANNTTDMIDDIQVTTLNLTDIIDDMNELNRTVNSYHDSAISAVDTANNIINSVDTNISVAADTLRTVNNMYKNSKGILNAGTKDSLNASMEIVNKSLDALKVTGNIKQSNDTIKSIWDEKIDELENDSNILKIDTEAVKTSFTSDKNPEPNSVQVVLRTQEIKKAEDNSVTDLESEDDNITPIKRIGNVFKKLFDFIKSFMSGK